MANIIKFKDKTPILDNDVFVAENATIIGDVTIGSKSSIWYSAVLRGDVNYIKIGKCVNVQDNATIHGTPETGPVEIGDYTTIGHNAIVHGCIIHENVLVGMGAVVLDNAIVNSNVIIGAGAVVTSGSELESGWIYGGIPAKKIKQVDMEKIAKGIRDNADHYEELYKEYK
ncbi:MAG: gamma carbonic anhydrase family protein [Bacteroidetes bacterium GWE2_29_8]|nr:MAG: gamma carbonic anhydrase family protein [Bacteroidetes bacterium GWE2_29_8]OFY17431.1 MAG: gamma carbonic anhydrase family protein [Bacteroidetes bacterium GWF2_29_10]